MKTAPFGPELARLLVLPSGSDPLVPDLVDSLMDTLLAADRPTTIGDARRAIVAAEVLARRTAGDAQAAAKLLSSKLEQQVTRAGGREQSAGVGRWRRRLRRFLELAERDDAPSSAVRVSPQGGLLVRDPTKPLMQAWLEIDGTGVERILEDQQGGEMLLQALRAPEGGASERIVIPAARVLNAAKRLNVAFRSSASPPTRVGRFLVEEVGAAESNAG